LAKLIMLRRPTHLVIALDVPGGCPARRELLPSYKVDRGIPASELLVQLRESPILLAEAGIAAYGEPGWEADDVLASLAATAVAAGDECEIFSADRDLFQTLSPSVRIVRMDGTVFGPDELYAKYGVTPAQYVELAAMRGEAADCIDGVPGIGEKTASKVLTAFGSVAAAVHDPVKLSSELGARLAERLVEHHHRVERNVKVATLRTDLDVAGTLAGAGLPLQSDRVGPALRSAGLPAAASAFVDAACRTRV
jgi:5'-3' exonuclease